MRGLATYLTKLFLLLSSVAPLVHAQSSEVTDECERGDKAAYDERVCIERAISEEPFVLIPHRPNYFIGSYESNVDNNTLGNSEYDNFEAKFQLSFKKPITDYSDPWRCLWLGETKCVVFFAYTQVSVWQMFNYDESAPFRDTNFEPELFVTQLLDRELFWGWRLRQVDYGLINHQSNGKTPPVSRSWNRSYIDATFQNGKHYLSVKAWKRWQEDPKVNPTDFTGDDNPGIEDYVGNAELRYFYSEDHNNYSLILRDSKNNPNDVNVEIGWSYPLSRRSRFEDSDLRFYVQYFNGFGETLIDYDIKRERIGMGVMLTDWL